MSSWDIFCKVVDNFGDAGVCWRLARQLANEHHAVVRLWIDDLRPLARIWPDIDPLASVQYCAGVDVRKWHEPASPAASETPHDAVIEAFACDTPSVFVEAMARRHPSPAWINLEYLSAEQWVDDCHLLPSPHPRLPLIKRFYFPGFTDRTGGLLRERDLLSRRDAHVSNPHAVADWWKTIGVRPPPEGVLKVSLFAYANPAARPLFETWIAGATAVFCVVPEGILSEPIATVFGAYPSTRSTVTRGALTIAIVPFLGQDAYDSMLWSCDFNFVRGEDSFVRAQWAGIPFVWNIYPQDGEAHLPKLTAFTERYGAAMSAPASAAMRSLFGAWNGCGNVGRAWDDALAVLPDWSRGAAQWSAELARRQDLAGALAETAAKLL